MNEDELDSHINYMKSLLLNSTSDDIAKLARIKDLLKSYILKFKKLPKDSNEKVFIGQEIKRLKKEISKINPMTLMSKIKTEGIDITDWVEFSEKYIEEMWKNFDIDKNVFTILDYLFSICPLSDLRKAENEHKKDLNNLSILDICSFIRYGRDDKKRIYSENRDIDKAIDKTLNDFIYFYSLNQIIVLKTLNSIPRKLMFSIERIFKIILIGLIKNKIIDKDLRETYKIILSYGLHENYICTSYIIPSQVEHLFLKLLKYFKNNIHTFDENGTAEEDIKLNEILGGRLNQLEKIFKDNNMDEKILYHFKYIFEHDNFRNDIYHGKCKDKHLQSNLGGYLWFLFTKLIYEMFKAEIFVK